MVYSGIFRTVTDTPPFVCEKIIIKALSHVSGQSEEEIEKDYSKTGDLGQVAYNVTVNKSQKALFSEELTLSYVYELLTKIAKTSGSGSLKTKSDIYTDLILNGSPYDAMFITRMVKKKGESDPNAVCTKLINERLNETMVLSVVISTTFT